VEFEITLPNYKGELTKAMKIRSRYKLMLSFIAMYFFCIAILFACTSNSYYVSSVCRWRGDYPVTIVSKEIKGKIKEYQALRWKSDYFTESGWSPEKRCIDVSERLEVFMRDETISFLTTGEENGEPIVCVAQSEEAPCKKNGILFTLQKTDDPTEVLKEVNSISDGASGPLDEKPQDLKGVFEDQEHFSINFRQRWELETTQVE
jgi:Circadian oscillating protein COP23